MRALLLALFLLPALAVAEEQQLPEGGIEASLLVPVHALVGGVVIAGPLANAGFADLARVTFGVQQLGDLEPGLRRTRTVSFVQAGIGAVRTGLAFGLLGSTRRSPSERAYYQRTAAAVLVPAALDVGFAAISITELVRLDQERRGSTLDRESAAWAGSAGPLGLHGVLGVGMALIGSLEFVLGGIFADISQYSSDEPFALRTPRRRGLALGWSVGPGGVALSGTF